MRPGSAATTAGVAGSRVLVPLLLHELVQGTLLVGRKSAVAVGIESLPQLLASFTSFAFSLLVL